MDSNPQDLQIRHNMLLDRVLRAGCSQSSNVIKLKKKKNK